MSDYDSTERVEQVKKGFHVNVSSKRGTGTRDQDEVTLDMWTEDSPNEEDLNQMNARVSCLMELRRQHQPDEEDENE